MYLFRQPPLICLLVVLFGTDLVHAQPPIGAEFQVNTYTTAYQGGRVSYGGGNQKDVAFGEDQGFVVVWQDYGDFDTGNFNGKDGSLGGIFGQRFSAGGMPIGSEFLVNAVTAGNQANPAIDMNGSGEFVVVWSSYLRVGYNYSWGIHGRRFDSQGYPIASQFDVATVANNFNNRGLSFPDIAMADNSPFVVTWETVIGDFPGAEVDVMARRYDANGIPQGAAFPVSTDTLVNHAPPRVAMDSVGAFVVVWEKNDPYSYRAGLPPMSETGIFGQRFGADGSRAGAEIQINSYTSGGHRAPAVGADSTGRFVVSWSDRAYREYVGNYQYEYVGRGGLFAQRFDSGGNALGTDFRVDSIPQPYLYAYIGPASSDIAVEPSGNFIVTWPSLGSFGDDTSYSSIQARSFGADGQPWGPEIQVNSWTTGRQNRPAVAGEASDKFVVVWDDAFESFYGSVDGQDGSLGGTFGQLFGSAHIFTDGFESGDTAAWSSTQ